MNVTLMSLLVVEIALTAGAISMFVWRSFLDMKEDDRLMLDQAEDHLAREQAVIRQHAGTASLYFKRIGLAWSLLAVVIIGVWLVQVT